jgi:hypothetical protein
LNLVTRKYLLHSQTEQQKKESRTYVQLCSCYSHADVEFLHILNHLHGANCLHKNARSSSSRCNFHLKD